MIEVMKSLGVGLIFGVLVSLFRLPLPAPPTLAGVMGIVGVYLGYVIVSQFMK
ncbi:XapX domain-containing protein [Brevibacillus ginsengisoli]|uniref:XapX domain-containing protein n=1 Tax=Brevibacillus ginsengisoli TaxID=363854 RepID=UPI003CF42675